MNEHTFMHEFYHLTLVSHVCQIKFYLLHALNLTLTFNHES